MSTRGRSASPESRDVDVDMDKQSEDKSDVKAIAVTNLTRNVVEAHLQTVFGFYGEVVKIDLPIYVKCVYHITSFFSVLKDVVVVLIFFLSSRSKQRKSLPGICRRGLSSHRHVPHERRTTRRRRAQSRALRNAPPTNNNSNSNARTHALALSPLPPTKRPRARTAPLPFPLAFTFALTPVPAPR
jgi:hypothetical protein